MAEKKDGEQPKQYPEEEKLGKIVDKINGELADEMKGRPYLFVVATGYELGKEGVTSRLAAQWSWRSNVYVGKEEGKALMEFLSNQLRDAAGHPETGIRKVYGIGEKSENKP